MCWISSWEQHDPGVQVKFKVLRVTVWDSVVECDQNLTHIPYPSFLLYISGKCEIWRSLNLSIFVPADLFESRLSMHVCNKIISSYPRLLCLIHVSLHSPFYFLYLEEATTPLLELIIQTVITLTNAKDHILN